MDRFLRSLLLTFWFGWIPLLHGGCALHGLVVDPEHLAAAWSPPDEVLPCLVRLPALVLGDLKMEFPYDPNLPSELRDMIARNGNSYGWESYRDMHVLLPKPFRIEVQLEYDPCMAGVVKPTWVFVLWASQDGLWGADSKRGVVRDSMRIPYGDPGPQFRGIPKDYPSDLAVRDYKFINLRPKLLAVGGMPFKPWADWMGIQAKREFPPELHAASKTEWATRAEGVAAWLLAHQWPTNDRTVTFDALGMFNSTHWETYPLGVVTDSLKFVHQAEAP